MKFITNFLLSVLCFYLSMAVSNAQDGRGYISLSGGLTELQSSANSGELTSAFTTGSGTAIPAGTVLPSGTSLSWNSVFKSGYNFGAAIGYSYGNGFRAEAEVRYIRNSVSSHDSVAVGGGSISSEDAGVLITGSGNLGASVSNIVADGQGNSATWAFMANAYFDFLPGEKFSPYIGLGAGYADTNMVFMPSAVDIANAGNGGFAYQGIAGIAYNISQDVGIFAEYRYFARDAVRVDLTLLPGYLDVENKAHLINVGAKIGF